MTISLFLPSITWYINLCQILERGSFVIRSRKADVYLSSDKIIIPVAAVEEQLKFIPDAQQAVIFHLTICERDQTEEEEEVEAATQQSELIQRQLDSKDDKLPKKTITVIVKKLTNVTKSFGELRKVNGKFILV